MNFPWIKEEKPFVPGPIKNAEYFEKLSKQTKQPPREKFDAKKVEEASRPPAPADRGDVKPLPNQAYYDKLSAPRPSHRTEKFSLPPKQTYRSSADMAGVPNPEVYAKLSTAYAPAKTTKFEVRRVEQEREERLAHENMAALGPVVNGAYWGQLATPVRPLDKIEHVPLSARVAAAREASRSPERTRSSTMAAPTAQAPRIRGTGHVAPPPPLAAPPKSDFGPLPPSARSLKQQDQAQEGKAATGGKSGGSRSPSESPRREKGGAGSQGSQGKGASLGATNKAAAGSAAAAAPAPAATAKPAAAATAAPAEPEDDAEGGDAEAEAEAEAVNDTETDAEAETESESISASAVATAAHAEGGDDGIPPPNQINFSASPQKGAASKD